MARGRTMAAANTAEASANFGKIIHKSILGCAHLLSRMSFVRILRLGSWIERMQMGPRRVREFWPVAETRKKRDIFERIRQFSVRGLHDMLEQKRSNCPLISKEQNFPAYAV